MTISFNIVTGITGIPKPGSSESSPQKKNTRRARSPLHGFSPRNSSKVDEKLASSLPLEFLIQLCKIRDKSPP